MFPVKENRRALFDALDALPWQHKPASAATHATTPSHCVEHSGGDTRCPGG
jgi:hypothetical protein